MDLLQEYKELYYKELEHSEKLNNKINTAITFLTVIGSAQVLLWTQFKNFQLCWYSVIYLIFCVISFIMFCYSLYLFYRAYSGYEYNYLPIKDMVNVSLQTMEIANSSKTGIKRAKKHINNMYCERFVNDAIHNRNQNFLKNTRHKRLMNFICVSFVITIITFSAGVIIEYYENTFIIESIHITIDGGEINVR